MEHAKDFWALARRGLPEQWPREEGGNPEPAARLTLAPEQDALADLTLSFLESCGIPAYKGGGQGSVVLGLSSLDVGIFVPASRLEEAQALLEAQPQTTEG